MAKYIKKPIPVEAVKFEGNIATIYGKPILPDWIMKEYLKGNIIADQLPNYDYELVIKTLEGDMRVSVGDYIINGIHGEIYPCKPDIFEETYDEVLE